MSASVEAAQHPLPVESLAECLGKMLVKDLYLSFKFSQGASDLHGHLFEALNVSYRDNLDSQSNEILRGQALAGLLNQAYFMKAPKTHTTNSYFWPGEPNREFVTQARRFEEKLCSSTIDDQLPVEAICRGTVRRDIAFQERQRGYQAPDKHASYFRDYVLLENPTGSKAFDYIFAQTAKAIAEGSPDLSLTLPSLAGRWEANHPGQQFYPEV